jgi:hypothetical protein
LETGVFDQDTFSGPQAALGFQRVRAAGGTVARIPLFWGTVAPKGAEMPAGFDPRDPADPHYDWSSYDRQVRLAVAAGLKPILTIFGAPGWALDRSRSVPEYKPDPAQFGYFAEATARRYSGQFESLPRVRLYQAWNEANLRFFLNPQLEHGRFEAAELYRRMVNRFAAGVKRVHKDNLVIAGGLAPFKFEGGPFFGGPLRFMRSLMCMSKGRRPHRTCRKRVRFDIWSHHPYTAGNPTHSAVRAEDVSLGDLPEMKRLLYAAVRAKQVVSSRRVRFWITEFSWDTNPPDPDAVPERVHARWVAEAFYRMWRAGVSLVNWYQVRDATGQGQLFSDTAESGLYQRGDGGLETDRPKLALQAYEFPFVALPAGRRIAIWGRTPNSGRGRVVVEQQVKGEWRELKAFRANRYGIFRGRVPKRRRTPLRARVPSQDAVSLAFAPHRTADRRVNPFGGPFHR